MSQNAKIINNNKDNNKNTEREYFCNCDNLGTPEQKEKFYNIFKIYNNKNDCIEVLHDVTSIYGFIPVNTIEIIAKNLKTNQTDIYGIISFYNNFTTTPKAKYNIDVCLGTACHVLGSKDIFEAIQSHLGLKVGELSKDNKYLISACRCLGCCGLAPVISINGEIIAHVTKDNIKDILDKLN